MRRPRTAKIGIAQLSRCWECLKYWNSDGMRPLCHCYLLFQIWWAVDNVRYDHCSWLLSPLSRPLSLSPDNLCWQEPSVQSRELPHKIGSHHPEIVVSCRLKFNRSDTLLTNEANNTGDHWQTGRDHQAVKVKVVASALSTGHYARGTHRAHRARAEQSRQHMWQDWP